MATSRELTGLALRLKEMQEEFRTVSGDTFQKAAARALQVAVFATRVKTGRARGGWIISLGPNGKFNREETPLDEGGGNTIARGQAEIARFRIEDGSLTLANNVEYIVYLDQGTPHNAADMMVAQATQAAIDFIKQGKFLES